MPLTYPSITWKQQVTPVNSYCPNLNFWNLPLNISSSTKKRWRYLKITQMFSQMIDQMENKNKWQKFGSRTWCYKPYPTGWPAECNATKSDAFGHFPSLDALTHVTIAIKTTFDNVTFGMHMYYACIHIRVNLCLGCFISSNLCSVFIVMQECNNMYLTINCTALVGLGKGLWGAVCSVYGVV